jgi:hypothetical protein
LNAKFKKYLGFLEEVEFEKALAQSLHITRTSRQLKGITNRQSATIKIKGEGKHVVDNPGDSFGVVVGGTRGECWRGLDSPFTGCRAHRLYH